MNRNTERRHKEHQEHYVLIDVKNKLQTLQSCVALLRADCLIRTFANP